MYQKLWCKNRVVVFLVNVFVIVAVAVLVAWAPYCCVSTCKTVHSISSDSIEDKQDSDNTGDNRSNKHVYIR